MAESPDSYTRFWESLEQRIHREWLAITLLTLLLSMGLSLYSTKIGLDRIDHTFYDSVLRARPQPPVNEDIVIIAIDDSSIRQLGRWPWRRAVHAQLLEYLADAKMVGFDIVFSERNLEFPEDDVTLAHAIERHGRVILPSVIDGESSHLHPPMPTLAQAAAGHGYINVYPDSDGTVRSLVLRQRLNSGREVEHFIVALLGQHPTDGLPLDQRLLIPYAGPAGRFTFVPYAAVLRGEVPAEKLRDRIVMIGAWASGMGDNHPTPMTRRGEAMSGIEIMANGLLALQNDSWIRGLPPWGAAILTALPVLLACLAHRRFSPRHAFLATLITCLSWPLFAMMLLFAANVWVPFSASLIGIALSFLLWTWRSQEASLQHIDRELQALRSAGPWSSVAADEVLSTPYDRSLPARVRLLHQSVVRFRQAQTKREETLRFLSHDMRAPQNGILAMIDMHDSRAGEYQGELLKRIRQRANDTLQLMDGFVQLEHAELAVLQQQAVELGDVIDEACDACWEFALRRSIAIETPAAAELAWVRGDRALLRRVLQNLLDNAIKYSPDHTTVRCSLRRDDAHWQIDIRDEGRGIPSDRLAHVFDAFIRVDADQPCNAVGAGLGLAFVRTTVHRHGGTVFARSEPGKGAVFTLRLPACDS